MLVARFFLFSIILIFVASCSVLNFSFFSSKKLTPASLEKFEPMIKLVEKWEVKIGTNKVLNSGVGSFAPKVTKNKVITTVGSGVISAFDILKGNQTWNIILDQKLLCSVGYKKIGNTELVAAVTEMGELILLNSSSEIIWKSKLNGIVRVSPVITNSVVVALYADNRVVAFDINSGKRVWVLKRRVPPLILHGQSGMTLLSSSENSKNLSSNFENGLLVNMAGGRIIFLNVTTGTVNWESRVVFSRGTNEVERIADLMGNPYVGNEVCTTAYQNSLVCLSLLNGEVIWRKSFNSTQPASFSESSVIAIDSNSKITAFNRTKNDSYRWKTDKFFLRKISAAVIWENAVWFVDKQGYLHGLSLKNGEIISRYRLKGGLLSGMIKTVQNGILIQTSNGQLLLLGKT
jgi:outer membrane protein assembly factor BamB